jgi:hypothetical protein
MMKDHTTIAVVVDRSGSMTDAKNNTIEGFNKFLNEQVALPGSADISVYQFDDKYEPIYENTPIKDAKHLNGKTYRPEVGGSTALYDALASTIHNLGSRLSSLPEQDRPNKVIVVTITDGYENASRDYSRHNDGQNRLKALIQQQENTYSWEFVFLGATLDAVNVATGLGFKPGSAASYTYGKESEVFTAVSKGVGKFRAYSANDRQALSAGTETIFDAEDRENIK